MYEKYQYLFDLYLSCCKAKYNPQNPYENLDACMEICENYANQLYGMVNLLEVCGIIERGLAEQEREKIMKEFSTIKICKAYVEDGQVFVFR